MSSRQIMLAASAIMLVGAWVKFVERPNGRNLARAVARTLSM